MTRYDDDLIDELMRLVAAEIEVADGTKAYRDEGFLSWLAQDLRAGMSGAEKAKDEREANAFARRSVARVAAHRAQVKLPYRELRHRAAPIVATVSGALGEAGRAKCATMLDLAVAAGHGRELWDEPCEQWLELPDDISSSDRYLAIRVAGDSMSPVLEQRDVILIKLGGMPAIDDLVVASVGDQGYVVKQVASLKNELIELASFNPRYKSIVIPRDRSSILGTVIARFKRE